MPFKTQYGSHYHMTQGCHGASIPCRTEGLIPCSDCCGTRDGGTPSSGAPTPSGMSAGAGSLSEQGAGEFSYEDSHFAGPAVEARHSGSDSDPVTDGSRITDAGRVALGSGGTAPSVSIGADALLRMDESVDAIHNLGAAPMPAPPITRDKSLHRLADDEVPKPVAGHTDDRIRRDVADAMERDVDLLIDATAKIRKAKGRTSGILDEVSQHMREISEQMRTSADGKVSSFDTARAFRMLNLDVARLEGDIRYMRDFGGEEGQVADVAAEVAERLRGTLSWMRLDARRNG